MYDALHDAIISGELPAGTRLRIRDVAAEVGTSVMPVREAIRRLEEGGFAHREPHKGAVVKGLTLEELIHTYDVRKILEQEAARRGSIKITAEGCALMEAEYGFMRAAIAEGRLEDHLRHDERLLTILYEASENPVLVSTIQSLWKQCLSYKTVGIRSTFDSSTSNERLWCYQRDLVAAARRNDPAAAVTASNASLDAAAAEIRNRLAIETVAADNSPAFAEPLAE